MAKLVGWQEWIALPDLDIDHLKVKVDTGAKTSSLHAFEIVSFLEDGEEWVTFGVHPLQDNTTVTAKGRAKVIDHRVIRDSGGHEETRVVISTDVVLADERWSIELTLTDRESMGFRMLLGREAVAGRFYVDSAQRFVLTADGGDNPAYKEEE